MCEPTTIAMFAIAVAGAVAQNEAQVSSIEHQAEVANRNTAEAYRVAQENERAAESQAFEQQTDRMRDASRQLAMARVISAEGGGSLAARAINIAAAADEDSSRIDAGLDNQRATVRGQMAAAQVGNADALRSAQLAGQGSQVQFFSNVAQAAGSAYASHDAKVTQKRLAEKLSSSYQLK